MVLKYKVPSTMDMELGRLAYYLTKQQHYVPFRKYALIALKNYLENKNEVLLKLDLGTPNQYIFQKEYSISLSVKTHPELITAIEQRAKADGTTPSLVFKNAILSSVEFTEEKIWISPALYVKSLRRNPVTKLFFPKTIQEPVKTPPIEIVGTPIIVEVEKEVSRTPVSMPSALPPKKRNPYISQFNHVSDSKTRS